MLLEQGYKKDEAVQYFIEALKQAGRRMSDEHYFNFKTAGSDWPVYRERVYCYELYHQLRCVLGDEFPYKLDGEVDKAAHRLIRGGEKPDFIVHVPGEMRNNLVIMEVKRLDARPEDIFHDLCNVDRFIQEANYHRGIMLLFGGSPNDFPECIRRKTRELSNAQISLMWHKSPGLEPKEVSLCS